MENQKAYKSDKATTRLNILGLICYKAGRLFTLMSYKFKKSDATNVKFYKNKHGRLYIDTIIEDQNINVDIFEFINKGYTFYLSDTEKDEFFFNIQNMNDRRNRYSAVFEENGINIIDEEDKIIHENLTALDIFENRSIVNALNNDDYYKALNLCKARRSCIME